MTNPIEIHTPRLLLKSITPGIILGLFEKKSKEEIMLFFNTDDDGYDHLRQMRDKGMETHRISLFYFLLLDKETKSVIGQCAFHTWNKTHDRAELFYGLKNDSDKRKGFMSEALPEILDFGFNTLGLHRVEALTAAWNTASITLLERHGFTKEGTMREDYKVSGKHENSECYSLLKREWHKAEE